MCVPGRQASPTADVQPSVIRKNNKKYFSVLLDDTETRDRNIVEQNIESKQKSIPVYRHYPEEDVVDKTNNPRKLGEVPNFSSALPDSRYLGQSENSGRSSLDDASSRSSTGADVNHVQHQAPQQQASPQQQQAPPLNYIRHSRPHSETDSHDKKYVNVKNPKTYSSYSEDSDECSDQALPSVGRPHAHAAGGNSGIFRRIYLFQIIFFMASFRFDLVRVSYWFAELTSFRCILFAGFSLDIINSLPRYSLVQQPCCQQDESIRLYKCN